MVRGFIGRVTVNTVYSLDEAETMLQVYHRFIRALRFLLFLDRTCFVTMQLHFALDDVDMYVYLFIYQTWLGG